MTPFINIIYKLELPPSTHITKTHKIPNNLYLIFDFTSSYQQIKPAQNLQQILNPRQDKTRQDKTRTTPKNKTTQQKKTKMKKTSSHSQNNSLSQSQLTNNIKTKFQHSKNKLIFFQTFIMNNRIYYILQCDNYYVYVGHANNFQIIWQGVIKNRILCASYGAGLLYFGTNKGIVYVVDFMGDMNGNLIEQEEQRQRQEDNQSKNNNGDEQEDTTKQQENLNQNNTSSSSVTLTKNNNSKNIRAQKQKQSITKIPSINGEPIFSIVVLSSSNMSNSNNSNQQPSSPQFITVSQSILRKYKHNKFQKQVKLPFRICKSVINKQIINEKDVALVFLALQKKFIYIFNWLSLDKIFQVQDQQAVNSFFEEYQAFMSYQPDQYINSSQKCILALSDTKSALALGIENTISVYSIQWKNNKFFVQPDFKIKQEQQFSKIDIIGSNMLYVSPKIGLWSFDFEKRVKVSKGLVFKGGIYQLGAWAQVPNKVIYGSMKVDKMKLIICERPSQKYQNNEDKQ